MAKTDTQAPEADIDRRKRKRSARWLWLIGGLALLLLGGAVFWWLSRPDETAAQDAPAPPLIRAAEAAAADRVLIRQTGFVRPRAEIAVSSQASGRIVEISEDFVVGRRVEAGDFLLRLEQARFEADIERAEARVQQAEASLAEARVNRERQEELQGQDFVSEARLQEAILQVATAQSTLAAARADLTQARLALNDTVIRAPFEAVVTRRDAAPGQLLQPGQSVGALVAAEAVEIEMGLVAADLALLGSAERALGGEVLIRDLAGRRLRTGVATEVNPQIETRTRTTTLIVAVADPFSSEEGPVLRVDELVQLELPVSLDGAEALRVPAQALKGGQLVWSVSDGRLDRHEVRVLQRGEDSAVVVAADLAPGEPVMLSDLAAAFDGQEVRVAEEPADGEIGVDPVGSGTGAGSRAGAARPTSPQTPNDTGAGGAGSAIWARPGPGPGAGAGSAQEPDAAGAGARRGSPGGDGSIAGDSGMTLGPDPDIGIAGEDTGPDVPSATGGAPDDGMTTGAGSSVIGTGTGSGPSGIVQPGGVGSAAGAGAPSDGVTGQEPDPQAPSGAGAGGAQ